MNKIGQRMKILYISTMIPSKYAAGSYIDLSVLTQLVNSNAEIDAILLKSHVDNHSIPEFFNDVYVNTTKNSHRIITSILFFFLPGMLIFRLNISTIKKIINARKKNYDIIYFSASQSSIYVFFVKILFRKSKKVLFLHDILQQVFYRRYRNEKCLLKKIYNYSEFRKLDLFESFFYKQFDLCVTLNAKDRGLLLEKNIDSEMIVPIYQQYKYLPADNNTFYVCYYGSFTRFENIDAVNYYLGTIHKIFVEKIPNYKYLIVGIDADKYFPSDKYIEVYGFQEDPSMLLNKCKVAIITLRYGAGIKIKVLQLLYLGIPCFCTTVGSEGISPVAGLITCDDIYQLADFVCNFYQKGNCNKDDIRKEFIKLYDLNMNDDKIKKIFSIFK
jgi:hypothetical protein